MQAAYPWQSIATPVLAFLILGAPFGASDAIGGVIIMAGLALCVYARWREGVGQDAALAAGGGHRKLVELGPGAGLDAGGTSGQGYNAASAEAASQAASPAGAAGMLDLADDEGAVGDIIGGACSPRHVAAATSGTGSASDWGPSLRA